MSKQTSQKLILRAARVRFHEINLVVTVSALIEKLAPRAKVNDREVAERREAVKRVKEKLIETCV